MQSTGHSSTQARSRTSTHGSAITYVTSVLHALVGAPSRRPRGTHKYPPAPDVLRTAPRALLRFRGRPHRSAGAGRSELRGVGFGSTLGDDPPAQSVGPDQRDGGRGGQ